MLFQDKMLHRFDAVLKHSPGFGTLSPLMRSLPLAHIGRSNGRKLRWTIVIQYVWAGSFLSKKYWTIIGSISTRMTKKLDNLVEDSTLWNVCWTWQHGLDSPPAIKGGLPDFWQHNKHTYSSIYCTVPSSMKYQKHPSRYTTGIGMCINCTHQTEKFRVSRFSSGPIKCWLHWSLGWTASSLSSPKLT